MKSIGFTYRIPMYIADRQNYIGFTYKSPIIYLYLFTVYQVLESKTTIVIRLDMAAPSGFAGAGPNGSFFETPGWVDKNKQPG